MMEPESHWRPDETLIDWVEEALRWPKVWELLEELPPSIQHNSAYEAELHFVPQSRICLVEGHSGYAGDRNMEGQSSSIYG